MSGDGGTPSTSAWGPAIALGMLVGSAAVFPYAGTVARDSQQFVLDFELAVSKPVTAEILFDRGRGFETASSLALPVAISATPRPYSVPLPAGRYYGVRFDPLPESGEFVLANARIRDRNGHVVRAIPLSGLQPSQHLVVREATAARLSAVAPPSSGDPFVQYAFESPVILWISRGELLRLVLMALLIAVIVGGISTPLLAADRPVALESEARAWRSPIRTIAVTAIVSSLAATYPLLLGRSLVTPNNGALPFHYPSPPYVAGSSDTLIESTRLADAQATMWVTLPYAVAQREALAGGEFPWWNRYSENGAPLLGQGQTAIFDPLQWLLFIGDLGLGADLKFVAARIVFTTGAAMAAFAVSGSLLAALAIALSAPFLGHFISRFNDAIHFSIVYAPWILAAYGGLLRAGTRSRLASSGVGLLLATALLMFASSPKEAFALLPSLHFAGALAIVFHARSTGAWSQAVTRLGIVGLAVVGSALLTAPHWLVFLETLSNAGTAYDATAFTFADSGHALSVVAGVFRPGMVYAGLNPVLAVLALVAVVRIRSWREHALGLSCTMTAALMLIVAFGGAPEGLLMRLPLVPRIHHVGATLLTAVLPLLMVVAALGAASLPGPPIAGERTRVSLAIALGLVMTIALVLTADLADPSFGFGIAACVWTAVLCYLVLRIASRPGRLTLAIAVVATVGLLLPAGLHVTTGVSLIDAFLVQPRERVALTSVPAPLDDVDRARGGPARIAGINGVFHGGVPSYARFEGITGGDSLFATRTLVLGKQFDLEYPLSLRAANPHSNPLTPLLDLWGVRWLVMPAPPSSATRLQILERESAWPRAFFVDKVERHADRRAFVQRLRSDSRPFASIDLRDEDARSVPLGRYGSAAQYVAGRNYTLTANTTAFDITAPSEGIVVLNETFWPGVTARIGDHPTTVLRVNETMRAIAVPAGTSRVTFAYRPSTWSVAVLLASAGALVLVGLFATARLSARQRS